MPSAPYIGSAMLDLPVCIFPNNGSSMYNLARDLAAAGAPAPPSAVQHCNL